MARQLLQPFDLQLPSLFLAILDKQDCDLGPFVHVFLINLCFGKPFQTRAVKLGMAGIHKGSTQGSERQQSLCQNSEAPLAPSEAIHLFYGGQKGVMVKALRYDFTAVGSMP
ncbi:hypothetical protein UY3_03773 [Chelonia mydas]|uniref:Uncharacterized protein n=1 Tax=Chelonia mydas TaxID=8469 RepID=M7BP75_CHEMY|nr:hypothetical protein UY3_03773 [Chelonia mydas]